MDIEFFSCRSIYVTYKETRTEKGIKLYRFTPPPEVFANASINPENEGFCVPECLDSGVLDVSVCRGMVNVLQHENFLVFTRFQVTALSHYLNQC